MILKPSGRRHDLRYPIQLELKWKLIRRRRVLESGTRRTVDVFSSSILSETGRHLPLGMNTERSISRPMPLDNVAPLQLIVF
jgi:hypothetical protein